MWKGELSGASEFVATRAEWTPSVCKEKVGGNASTAAARVDATWTAMKTAYDSYDPDTFYHSMCGFGKVKVDADIAWACASFQAEVVHTFGCHPDRDCTKTVSAWACESLSAMLTAVCTLAADEIKTTVASLKTVGSCKDKTDGGLEFSTALCMSPCKAVSCG